MDLRVSDPGALAEKFASLSRRAQSANLEAATRAAALPVLNQLRLTVHEGGRTPYKTGTLRRSFSMETLLRSPMRCVVGIGTNVPYARRLEYGFVGADKLGRVYNQAPHPYIRPAMDENRGKSRREFRAAMMALLEGGVAHATT